MRERPFKKKTELNEQRNQKKGDVFSINIYLFRHHNREKLIEFMLKVLCCADIEKPLSMYLLMF